VRKRSDKMFDRLIQEMSQFSEVEAIALGGSRATGTFDDKSDYDVYVYLYNDLAEDKRRELLDKYCKTMEYSNSFWELEDDGVLNNEVEIEFIYRNLNDVKNGIQNVLEGNVGHGYTTCFIDNVITMKILYDNSKKLTQLQRDLKNTDLSVITQKVIDQNFPLLNRQLPSMYNQIKKAINRNDVHSINHRVTAFFEMYYDILFALNNKTHPGEKRLLENSLKLKRIPVDHKVNVENVFVKMFNDNYEMLNIIDKLSINIGVLITEMGFNK